jgi:hypothetical protein
MSPPEPQLVAQAKPEVQTVTAMEYVAVVEEPMKIPPAEVGTDARTGPTEHIHVTAG